MIGTEKNPFDLTGRTALITGAAGLLGIEHARALWDSGASVVMTDVDETALSEVRCEVDTDLVYWHVMDVTSADSVMEVSRSLLARGVRVDVLVNNRRVASGEIVVVDGRYGVRITSVEGDKKV